MLLFNFFVRIGTQAKKTKSPKKNSFYNANNDGDNKNTKKVVHVSPAYISRYRFFQYSKRCRLQHFVLMRVSTYGGLWQIENKAAGYNEIYAA